MAIHDLLRTKELIPSKSSAGLFLPTPTLKTAQFLLCSPPLPWTAIHILILSGSGQLLTGKNFPIDEIYLLLFRICCFP